MRNFLTELDNVLEECEMMLKKLDKKEEKTLLQENRQSLILQLNQANESDFALNLHLSVLLLFQSKTKKMLHASGKFVPQILNFLKPFLNIEVYQTFHECQELVINQIKLEKENKSEEKEQNEERLKFLITIIKKISFEM